MSDDSIKIIRTNLLKVYEQDEAYTFADGYDEAADERSIELSNHYMDLAVAEIMKIKAMGDSEIVHLLPLLDDENMQVRLTIACAIDKKYSPKIIPTLIAIAEAEPRDLPNVDLDINTANMAREAQQGLWIQIHGTVEGFWDAPDYFWQDLNR